MLLAAVIYLGVQAFVPPYAVDGASMDPTLHNGDRLLVSRSIYFHVNFNEILNLLPGEDRPSNDSLYFFHPPVRGDVVVFYPPVHSDRPYIKRVIGVPGDTISFADGYVVVNGEPLKTPEYLGDITFCTGKRHCQLTVPPDMIYVLGDNRGNSLDSRSFGPVSYDAVVGQAWITNWPLSQFGFVR